MIDRPPAVTVGLPVYNGARYLREAVDTTLAQTFTDFELVISDNGSTDETRAICEGYARSDARVRYYRSEVNRGAAWNFNRVLELARGRYFKWTAHDDRCEPALLERCVASLGAKSDAVLAYSKAVLLDDDGKRVGERPYAVQAQADRPEVRFTALLHATKSAPPVFGLIRTEVLRQAGGLGRYDASDLVLMAALGLRGRFVEIPELLMFIRDHAHRSVRANPSPYGMTAWFAPDRAGRLMFPGWRVLGGFANAIRLGPVSVSVRGRCFWELARWAKWHRHRFLEDIRVASHHLASRAGGLLNRRGRLA